MNNNKSPELPPQIQFATAESTAEAGAAPLTCCLCRMPVVEVYYAVEDRVVCQRCSTSITDPPTGNRLLAFGKAVVFGTAAGLLGALIWYAIRVIASIEIGLVAILVGWMVGKSVRRATAGRGGRVYQFLAVVITYSCISLNYAPDIISAILDAAQKDEQQAVAERPDEANASAESSDATAAMQQEPEGNLLVSFIILVVALICFSLAAPIMMGFESPIGLLIIGFALWEAWKISAIQTIQITGPYQIGKTTSLTQA